MRVIGGRYKGKTIPFTNSRYGNADITMQMVKEALFDILGRRVQGSVFLDLFACSGQVGFEALSRGASTLFLNESARDRIAFLKKMKTEFSLGDECIITGFDAKRALRYYSEKGLSFDIIFLDPPYLKEKGVYHYYDELLDMCSSLSLLNKESLIVIQHFTGNILSESCGTFSIFDSRKYGQNTLTFYRSNE